MTKGDLDITFGTYHEAVMDYDYGYIGSGDYLSYMDPNPDLSCGACHSSGADGDPGPGTRYYRRPWRTPVEITGSSAGVGTPDNLSDNAISSGSTLADGTQWVSFDLGDSYFVMNVRLFAGSTHQSEWDVYVSTNGSDWGAAVKTGWQVGSQSGDVNHWHETPIIGKIGRYIKIEGVRTHGTQAEEAIFEFDFLWGVSWRTPVGVENSYTDNAWSSPWQTPVALVTTLAGSGTHDGGDNRSQLTDTTATWADDELIGMILHNPGKGWVRIYHNTATRVWGLSQTYPAAAFKWDNGDSYEIRQIVHVDDEFGYPERIIDDSTDSRTGVTLGWLSPQGLYSATNLSDAGNLYDDAAGRNTPPGAAYTAAGFETGSPEVIFDLGGNYTVSHVKFYASGHENQSSHDHSSTWDVYVGDAVADTWALAEGGWTVGSDGTGEYGDAWYGIAVTTQASGTHIKLVGTVAEPNYAKVYEFDFRKADTSGTYGATLDLGETHLVTNVNFLVPTGAGSTWNVYVSDDPNETWGPSSQALADWIIAAPSAYGWWEMASDTTAVTRLSGRYARIECVGNTGDPWDVKMNWFQCSFHNPEQMIDGDIETGSGLHELDTEYGIVFDMGGSCTVDHVRLYGCSCWPSLNTEWDVYVSASPAGGWVQIISNWAISGSAEQWYTSAAGVSVSDQRYIKLVGKRLSAAPGSGFDWIMAKEFQFHASNN